MGLPALRSALMQRYPWVADVDLGPRAVDAGECDVCGVEARLVAPCGPPPVVLRGRAGPGWAVGRRCLEDLGEDMWCGGHAREAAFAREWAAHLPREADVVARLWWVATGEVRLDPQLASGAATLGLPLDGPGAASLRR